MCFAPVARPGAEWSGGSTLLLGSENQTHFPKLQEETRGGGGTEFGSGAEATKQS